MPMMLFDPVQHSKYTLGILIKEAHMIRTEMELNYVVPLVAKGIPESEIIAFSLEYNEHGKCPVKLIVKHLSTVLKSLKGLGVKTILVADTAYFKVLAKVKKTEPHYGYILPCAIDGFKDMEVVLAVNYKALFFNPKIQTKLDLSLAAVADHITGVHIALGTGVLHDPVYPQTVKEIQEAIQSLHQYHELTCDIETFSLQFHKAGIGTIAFAWNQHEGMAFCVDIQNLDFEAEAVKNSLREFFRSYKGKLIYHGSTFDIKILIYQLFMSRMLDYEGLLNGLEIMCRDIDDTMLMTYLATNSTARNELGLKPNAFEFTGNYAQDNIEDITKIPVEELLEYNLTDAVATWYVKDKYWPVMVQDDQVSVYETIFRPSIKVIIQMELTGMPLDMDRVYEVKDELSTILFTEEAKLQHHPYMIKFEDVLRERAMIAKNEKLKVKVKPLSDFIDVAYNPASPKQTAFLLHDYFGFPVIDKTETGLPATGAKTLTKHLNQLKLEFNITDEELKE